LSSSSDLVLCLSLAFDRLLRFFYSFLFLFFSLLLLYVGVVNALIKGEIEDHVWFEDRWMVASLCDE
jgi:TRAP-type C4-dicarboxylate transport system permease small subunit